MKEELLKNILEFQAQIKIMHWNTESYAEHIAFNSIYSSLDGLFDNLIEVCIGKFQRTHFKQLDITLYDYNKQLFNSHIFILIEKLEMLLEGSGSEIINILDEIKAELNKLKYLLSLR